MQPPESSEPSPHEESQLPHGKSLPILLVGASVRAAAESAVRAGIPVIACDLFGDRNTKNVSQAWIPLGKPLMPKDISVVKNCSETVIAGGLAGGYQTLVELTSEFRGADPLLMDRVSDPKFLSDLASKSSVRFPAFCFPASGRLGSSRWPRSSKQRALVKTRSSSGGLGVRWASETAIPATGQTPHSGALAESTPKTTSVPAALEHDAYIQRFVAGRSLGATFIGNGHQSLLLGVCRSLKKRIGEHPFVYSGSVGPIYEDRISDAAQRVGNRFVESTGFLGPFNLDFIDDGNQVWLLEINPRWSASMEIIELAWMRKLDEPCSFFDPPDVWRKRIRKTTAGSSDRFYKRVLFANQPIDIDPKAFPADSHAARWRDVPTKPTKVGNGMPVATLLADLNEVGVWECRRILRQFAVCT